MKKAIHIKSRSQGGFTLIELLVVIAIIAILAGILLPVLGRAKLQAKVAKAKIEMQGIETAIKSYQQAYSRLPASQAAQAARTPQSPDQTYGTYGAYPPATAGGKPNILHNDGTYEANNSEVMAILLDVKDFVSNQRGNSRNPDHTRFLNLNRVNTAGPGLGPDGVYRDPWGNPYIISLDLNFDEYTRDAFYKHASVSATGTGTRGYYGLTLAEGSSPPAYEAARSVMVWSMGPDGLADLNTKAELGVNKDNILTWE